MSTDFFKGGNQKKLIIVHHTASISTAQGMLNFFRRIDRKSIHYIVALNAEVAQQIDENDIAFHAGVSAWGRWKDINPVSIGIEIISDGKKFTDIQRDAVFKLVKEIMKRHNIPADRVLRHADVAMPRGRKWDVGPNFYEPRWGSWEGFQEALRGSSVENKEAEEAKAWMMKHKVSNGERPGDFGIREESWVMLRRFSKLSKDWFAPKKEFEAMEKRVKELEGQVKALLKK